MNILSLVIILSIGAAAGWLAGIVYKGAGFGLVGNIAVGIAGAVLGGVLFDLLGIFFGGVIGMIIMATAGAILLLYIISLVKRS